MSSGGQRSVGPAPPHSLARPTTPHQDALMLCCGRRGIGREPLMHLNLRIRKERNRFGEGGDGGIDEDLLFCCYYCEHDSSRGRGLTPYVVQGISYHHGEAKRVDITRAMWFTRIAGNGERHRQMKMPSTWKTHLCASFTDTFVNVPHVPRKKLSLGLG